MNLLTPKLILKNDPPAIEWETDDNRLTYINKMIRERMVEIKKGLI